MNKDKHKFLDEIFHFIQDGIIVMNQVRDIIEMNPAAKRLTGWNIEDKVPYCSFCQRRDVEEGHERCYLISTEEVPYFLSEMPTYHGNMINVEMSTALILEDKETNQKYYLLVLRDQTIKRKEEEARISKLMLKRLTEAKEMEHKRLAQELHDNVGQSLYSIAIALDNTIRRVKDEKLHEYINEVRQELGRVMEDVKLYSQQLRPKSLDELGLTSTIESLIQSMRTKLPDTNFSFFTNVEERLPPTIEINVYRVIQEALHNMLKYSKAKNVDVTIEKKGESLYVKVMDDGVGFDMEEKKEGLGLRHIQERISQVGGTTDIHSEMNGGTIISIQIRMEEGVMNEGLNCR